MKLTKLALTTTALTLLAGAVAAQDNATDLLQDGTGNNATINQSQGSDNVAGNADEATALRQTGDYNDLTITQSGNDNEVGLGRNDWNGTNGVLQSHNGILGSDSSTSEGDRGNSLTIRQQSDNNIVGAVSQSSTGQGDGTRNSAVLTQRGAGNHEIGSIQQYKNSSTRPSLTVDQQGNSNRIAKISQWSTSGGRKTNQMDVTMTGNNNGQGTLFGEALIGVESSTLIQGVSGDAQNGGDMTVRISGNGNDFGAAQYGGGSGDAGNTLSLQVDGNRNDTGSFQRGTGHANETVVSSGSNGNSIGSIQSGAGDNLDLRVSASSENAISTRQFGAVTGNDITMRLLNGADGNVIESTQSNDDNTLILTVNGGSDNSIVSDQTGFNGSIDALVTGNFNDLTFNQSGQDQTATATISGSNNYLSTMQEVGGLGTGNELTVTMSGDRNNTPGMVVSRINGVSLRSGTLTQSGDGNDLTMTVAGNNNDFGIMQVGTDNTFTGSQSTNGNAMAVLQSGDANVATVMQ